METYGWLPMYDLKGKIDSFENKRKKKEKKWLKLTFIWRMVFVYNFCVYYRTYFLQNSEQIINHHFFVINLAYDKPDLAQQFCQANKSLASTRKEQSENWTLNCLLSIQQVDHFVWSHPKGKGTK